jgi:hypothetical protein
MLAAFGLATPTPAGSLVTPVGAQILQDGKNRLVEMIVELVRRLEFSDKPSRYTSVFAFSTVEAAEDFRAKRGQADDPVWRARCEGPIHEADARCVDLASVPLAVIDRALRYWRGEFGPDPEQWHERVSQHQRCRRLADPALARHHRDPAAAHDPGFDPGDELAPLHVGGAGSGVQQPASEQEQDPAPSARRRFSVGAQHPLLGDVGCRRSRLLGNRPQVVVGQADGNARRAVRIR